MDLSKGKQPNPTPKEMAFPLIGAIPTNPLSPHQLTVFLQGGMTLRDYFAGQYLLTYTNGADDPKRVSEWCYKMADAMMAERSKHES